MKPRQIRRPGRVRAALIGMLGGYSLGSLSESDVLSLVGVRAAGQEVTEKSILSLSAGWACARLITETIGTLPVSMYERKAGGRVPAPNYPLHYLLAVQPNPDTVSSVLLESLVAAMMLRGAGRCEKLMVGDRVVGLEFLAPSRLAITRGPNGEKQYRYTDDNGRQRQIPASRIWTVPGWSLDGKNGLSVIQYGARVFGAALATESAAAGTFERGLLPTTWFKYPRIMKEGQREEARKFIENRLSGAINAGRPAILEADMEVGTVGIDPVDAQLLESRGYSVEEVCRWFRVPPWMVGHAEKSTSWGTGIEQQMIGFLTFTLAPWLRRIEQYIVKDLLPPADKLRYYPKFAVEGLLRADSAARATFYGIMVDKGILTRDEVRELEDRPPMGGNAAMLTVQAAMTMLDNIGNSNAVDQQVRNALRAWLKDEESV